MIWQDRTKIEYQAQYEKGVEDERFGRLDEAEVNYRSALDGLYHLLTATHPETVTVAYTLASFFAQHVRMQDADTVLDWLTKAHIESLGPYNQRTLDHIINVCEMFRSWGRPRDSVELLQQYLDGSDKAQFQPVESQPLLAVTREETLSTEEHPLHISIPSGAPAEPSMVQAQIRQVTSNSQTNGSVEASLLRLLRHCEQLPEELLAHSLLCHAALVDHYEDIGDTVKKSTALDMAEEAAWNVLRLEKRKSRNDLVTPFNWGSVLSKLRGTKAQMVSSLRSYATHRKHLAQIISLRYGYWRTLESVIRTKDGGKTLRRVLSTRWPQGSRDSGNNMRV